MSEHALTILPDAAVVAAASDTALRCMGDLHVLGSLLRVDADAAGSIECEGHVGGGRIVCGGDLRCGTLGEDDAATQVWVGAPPPDARALVEETWRQDASLARELGLLTPGEVGRAEALQEKRRGLAWRLVKLAAACGGGTLSVTGQMRPGVSVRLGLRPARYTFHRTVAGPLDVFAEEDGKGMLRQGVRLKSLHTADGRVLA